MQQERERSEGHAGLRSMGEGTPPLPHQVRRVPPGPGGDRQTSTWGLALAGAGHQVGAAQGGRHQGPPESEGPQEGLAVPGGLTGGRMVGEQGRHIWHG